MVKRSDVQVGVEAPDRITCTRSPTEAYSSLARTTPAKRSDPTMLNSGLSCSKSGNHWLL